MDKAFKGKTQNFFLIQDRAKPYTAVRLWNNLSLKRRKQLALLVCLMLASALAELVSLGSVIPFLAILSGSQDVFKSYPLLPNLDVFKELPHSYSVVFYGLALGIAVIIASGLRLLNLWAGGKLAASVGAELSCKAYANIICQPYEKQIQMDSSQVITALTTNVNRSVLAIMAFLQFFAALACAIFLMGGIILVNWKVAISIFFIVVSTYVVIAISLQQRVRINSGLISLSSKDQVRSLQEGLGARRDILIDKSQPVYVNEYKKADLPQRILQAQNLFLADFPRYSIEAVGFCAIALIGSSLSLAGKDSSDIIVLMGALALGAQKFLPYSQQVYCNWAAIKSFNSDLEIVLSFLDLKTSVSSPVSIPKTFAEVCFHDVSYSYPGSNKVVLADVNIAIRKGERVGIIGPTGNGKSTLVDLLMGLLLPINGRILVDGNDIHARNGCSNLESWQSCISHVPQSVYLSSGTIAENIAFGVRSEDINFAEVRSASERAQISSYIESLDNGYYSRVGDGGIRLSGGQRQRIAIARALYKGKSILVLDEATSALDSSTELMVMDSIKALSKYITVIIVAHRLSTLECCDKIFEVKNGNALAVKNLPE